MWGAVAVAAAEAEAVAGRSGVLIIVTRFPSTLSLPLPLPLPLSLSLAISVASGIKPPHTAKHSMVKAAVGKFLFLPLGRPWALPTRTTVACCRSRRRIRFGPILLWIPTSPIPIPCLSPIIIPIPSPSPSPSLSYGICALSVHHRQLLH